MQVDEGILNRRTWIIVGVAFVVVLTLLIGGTVGNQPPAPAPYVDPTATPPWRYGDAAVVVAQTSATAASGSVDVHGVLCEMPAGATGTVVELGISLGDPQTYVELRTAGCTGWVPAMALIRP